MPRGLEASPGARAGPRGGGEKSCLPQCVSRKRPLKGPGPELWKKRPDGLELPLGTLKTLQKIVVLETLPEEQRRRCDVRVTCRQKSVDSSTVTGKLLSLGRLEGR